MKENKNNLSFYYLYLGEIIVLKEIFELIPFKEILVEGIKGYMEVANTFVDNYSKRTGSGFSSWDSIGGSLEETSNYYYNEWTHKEPKVWIQAVYFVDKNGNRIR